MTPDLWRSLAGGQLIGAGAATLLLLNGRIAGISGILDNAVHGAFGAQAWRIAFLLGLVAPAAVYGRGAIRFAQGAPALAAAGARVSRRGRALESRARFHDGRRGCSAAVRSSASAGGFPVFARVRACCC
jgi:hypothetical protein